MIANMIMSFVLNHKQLIEGMAIGYATAHIPMLVGMLFRAAMKIPAVHNFVVKNPEAIKEAISEVQKELDKDIDAEAKGNDAPKVG